MSYQKYKDQVKLMLAILPFVSKEKNFALHGGTAINLFQFNMPRLSVDVDLTYIPIQDRDTSLANIKQSLDAIKRALEQAYPEMAVEHKKRESKLMITNKKALVKVEVNQIKRGCYTAPSLKNLCIKAQEEFELFCEMQVVETGHLFGGKICAALDRQHPRDLFDISNMLKKEPFSETIKKGFIFYLISSNRPIAEMLKPHNKEQRGVFEKQFLGMTNEPFSYDEYEEVRSQLIKTIHQALTNADKLFLLSIEMGKPDWQLYDFKDFPAVQWKLMNVERLMVENPKKHLAQIAVLRAILLGNENKHNVN
ncbi:MAG: nucleotidyl transferase AbiEii/AbiGii toxin family protein [Lutibacter sp.]|nr:nucleotidyl transferase AbiEii/AbiGii toxin family protein [Lutibacter sp.]